MNQVVVVSRDLIDISGLTEISDEGIKKHFKNIESWQPLFELVWNGFDAKATNVSVQISDTTMGGTDAVSILDDGDGIDSNTLKDTFGRFNESAKREDAAQHGAHGRGRLAFHKICRFATWHTRSLAGDARIEVDATSIKKYSAKQIPAETQCAALQTAAQGTLTELGQFSANLPAIAELRDKFSIEYGWFLALHPNKSLTVNGSIISVPRHEITTKNFKAGSYEFNVQVIRWEDRPSSEKSFTYLIDDVGNLVYKRLSTLNNKAGFFTSVCVSSPWARNFQPEYDLLNPDAPTLNSVEWKVLQRRLDELTDGVYEDFLRRQAETVIADYVEDGYFPTYADLPPEERDWRLANSKELIKQVYIADPTVFNAASKKQRKIIVRLLDRLAVSNENDSLFEVLNSVLELDERAIKKLAQQLKQTTLENIISTIEVLQRRHTAASQLRTLMNEHYLEVLETPDLQKIIENNTWLFGPGYETLGAEEDTFTKIAKRLRDSVGKIDDIDAIDVEDVGEIPGAKRQTDLFLARKFPTYDSAGNQIYRCVIVEIKRPGISLNKKHLRQLDDYADIIKRHAEFKSQKMNFELILVGRQISSADTEIQSRMNGQISRGEHGLVSHDPGMKRFVLNWYTLLDSFMLTNTFMLDQLRLKRSEFEALSKAELVEELQGANP